MNVENENVMPEQNKLSDRIRKACPVGCRIMFCVALLSLVIFVICCVSVPFADFWNRYPGAFVRMVGAKLTGWFPFSLAETMAMMIPVLLITAVAATVVTYKKTVTDMLRLLMIVLSVLAFFFSSFALGFSAGYRGSPVEEKLGLTREKVSAEELYGTFTALSERLGEEVDSVAHGEDDLSVMPYSFAEMNAKLNEAYKKAAEKYGFIPSFSSTVKQIVHSEPMTYTHISGVYSFFTGESNVNVNFPDYIIPFTAAHEMAHQRGIAKEDEANFVAFLVCLESDDAYIRYSAYLNVYEYVASSLHKADSDLYKKALSGVDMRIRYELYAYGEFFEKYEKNVAATVSNAVNDTYLKAQGQKAGVMSYDLVTDLAVAYYKAGLLARNED